MAHFDSLTAMARRIDGGDYVALGGFQLNRVPVALLREIAAARPGGLRVVSAPNPLGLDILCAAGQVSEAQCGFLGVQYEHGFVMAGAVRRALAEGALDLVERDVYDTILELRAAAAGEGERPRFTLLHAQQADSAGNLRLTDPYADELLAAASGRVLATVEEVVDRIESPTIPAAQVEQIAVCPAGAAPGTCLGYTERDAVALSSLLGHTVPDGVGVADDRGVTDADRLVTFTARQIRDGDTVVTGLASAQPMLAIELARRTHAPTLRYINCVGAVNPRVEAAMATSVDPALLQDCESQITLPQLFDLAAAGGVDVMFFGAAQIDRRGAVNLTRVGPADRPRVKLPGPAGSPSMRAAARRVVITVPQQSPRHLVHEVDVATSVPSTNNVETTLVTNLAVWRLDGEHGLEPLSVHANVSAITLREATGFSYNNTSPSVTAEPGDEELSVLRALDPTGMRHRWAGRRPSSADIKERGEVAS